MFVAAIVVAALFGSFNPPALLGQQQQQVPTPVGSTVYGDSSEAPMFVPQAQEYSWINFERTHLRCLEVQAGPPVVIVRTHVFLNLELVKPGTKPAKKQGPIANQFQKIDHEKPAYVLTFAVANDNVTLIQVNEAVENGKTIMRRLGHIVFERSKPTMYPASEKDNAARTEEVWKMAEAVLMVEYDVRKAELDEQTGMNKDTRLAATGAFKFVEKKALQKFAEFEWPSKPRDAASPGDKKNPFSGKIPSGNMK